MQNLFFDRRGPLYLRLSLPKLNVRLSKVTVFRLVELGPQLVVVLQDAQVGFAHYLTANVVFRYLGPNSVLNLRLLAQLRQVLITLLFLRPWCKLNFARRRRFFHNLLGRGLPLPWRLVVLELALHLGHFALQLLQLLINREHAVVDRLIQIHF